VSPLVLHVALVWLLHQRLGVLHEMYLTAHECTLPAVNICQQQPALLACKCGRLSNAILNLPNAWICKQLVQAQTLTRPPVHVEHARQRGTAC
jgi:hypothetical protein